MRIPVTRGSMIAKWLATACAAAVLAGCSNSIERFSAGYNNPSDNDPVYTASVREKKPVYKRPVQEVSPIEEETIVEGPVTRASVPQKAPANSYVKSYKKAYKQPSYEQPIDEVEQSYATKKPGTKLIQAPAPDESEAYVSEEPVARPAKKRPFQLSENYKAEEGTVRVVEGMTLYSIARANKVSVDKLAAANNIEPPYNVVSGQIIRIPGAQTAEQFEQPVKKRKVVAEVDEPVARPSKKGVVHKVSRGETLYSLGRKYGVSPFSIADANGLSRDQSLSLGQSVRIPGASQAMASAEDNSDPSGNEEINDTAPQTQPKKKKILALTEEQVEEPVGEEKQAEAPAIDEQSEKKTAAKQKLTSENKDEEQLAAAPATATGMNLRWPVKGKVISDFGPKANGLKNEGINIAVPEGTSIRAADAGVVAYAGSELKGYGNLVLIRHTNGYVTAYAHAKELLVKRGDTVKRGDVIAKAGQTGAVSSPQLHFEVRKGATALDPMKHLSSTTAMN